MVEAEVVTVLPSVVVVAKKDVVVEHTDAVSVVHSSSGSDEYVSWRSGPMVILGHGGSDPLRVKPGGHWMGGGGPGG